MSPLPWENDGEGWKNEEPGTYLDTMTVGKAYKTSGKKIFLRCIPVIRFVDNVPTLNWKSKHPEKSFNRVIFLGKAEECTWLPEEVRRGLSLDDYNGPTLGFFVGRSIEDRKLYFFFLAYSDEESDLDLEEDYGSD